MVGRKESGFSCCCTIPPGKKWEGGGGSKRSVKTPGDHRPMDAIGSIDWKKEIRDYSHVSCTFTGDQGP